MRSAATAFALLLLLAATPVMAQGRPVEWTLWGSMVSPQGSNDLGDFSIENDDGVGVGLSANFFITDRLSTEIGVSWLSTDADMSFEGIEFEMDSIEMIPVTLGLQYHFVPESRWDPYVGAGAAWVSASDVQSADLDALGVGTIDLDDEVSWFANAGVGYRLGDQFGLAFDVRYLDYGPTSTSKATGGTEELELSPLVASLGLRVRF
ncbi:MAG: OmpW family outer membrane protein [Thermoanaerobaculia bacterium]